MPKPAISAFGGDIWQQSRFYALLGFLTLCLLGGGAARSDVVSLLYLRPAALLCLIFFLLSPGRWELKRFRILFLFLALLAASMLVQLVPLPPGLWAGLPGHAPFTEAAAAAGFEEPWRPLSLTPDLTLNSFLALLPCLVVLVGLAGVREDQRRALLPVLIAFAFADALLGMLQTATGADSQAYLYKVTNNGIPVGFFSNRNHHATLLALTFPLLAFWIGMPARSRQYERARLWIAVVLGLFLIPMILATGSRAGAIAGGIGLLIAYWCAPRLTTGWARRWRVAFTAGISLIPILLVVLTIYANRAVSLDRVADTALLESEGRLTALPVLAQMVMEFPLGAGYGSFDPVFRVYEPDSALNPQYFNHAHNDLLELAITGGAPALLLLAAFLLWWSTRTFRSFVRLDGDRGATKFARLGGIIILFLLATSLVDYPLRTPLLSAVFAIACGWLAVPLGPSEASETSRGVADAASAGRGRANWVIRGALAILIAAAAGWITLGVTAALVLGRSQPSIVLQWWPFDAGARAIAAARVLENPRPAQPALAEATDNAQAALKREPLNVNAARTLGLLAAIEGNEHQANRLMRYSETLSRRDMPTQLWLIENHVQRNDIGGALLHYDRALRTSNNAKDLLFPILMDALASPDVRLALARLLAQRPPWWHDFAERLVAEGRSPIAVETIVTALRLDPGDAGERGIVAGAVNRLIEVGSYERALRVYYRSTGGSENDLVRNGDFEAENRYAPLDWVLGDAAGFAGIMESRGGGGSGRALFFAVQDGSSGGTIARQLLVLRPGAYRFSLLAGTIAGPIADRPRIILFCVRTNEALLDFRLPVSPAAGRQIAQDFTVGSSGCPAQWLIVHASDPADENGLQPWIDKIAVHAHR